jgi:hypothetical protein
VPYGSSKLMRQASPSRAPENNVVLPAGEAGRVHAREASPTTTPAGGRAGGVGTTPSSPLGGPGSGGPGSGGPGSGGPASASVAALSVAASSVAALPLTGAGAAGGRMLGVAGPISLDPSGVGWPPPVSGAAAVGAGAGVGATVRTSENRSEGSAEQAASAKSQETTPKQARAPPRTVKHHAWTAPMPVPMRGDSSPTNRAKRSIFRVCELRIGRHRATGPRILVVAFLSRGCGPNTRQPAPVEGLERRRSMRTEVQRCSPLCATPRLDLTSTAWHGSALSAASSGRALRELRAFTASTSQRRAEHECEPRVQGRLRQRAHLLFSSWSMSRA